MKTTHAKKNTHFGDQLISITKLTSFVPNITSEVLIEIFYFFRLSQIKVLFSFRRLQMIYR